MKRIYVRGEVPEQLDPMKRFWNGTAEVYSGAKLTTEGGEDIEVILDRSKNIKKLICLGVATGCRDPLVFLDSGMNPKKILVNDISPELLSICFQNLESYPDIGVIALEGDIKASLEKQSDPVSDFLGEIEPLFVVGVYRQEIFLRNPNGYSALELYSEERENIGEDCTVLPMSYNGKLEVESESGVNFKLPLDKNDCVVRTLESLESNQSFSGFEFNSTKEGNPFISHYYTKDCLNKMLTETFPGFEIDIVDTKSRNYVAFVRRKGREQNSMITMINNVLGNIPLDRQLSTLESIRNTFYQN